MSSLVVWHINSACAQTTGDIKTENLNPLVAAVKTAASPPWPGADTTEIKCLFKTLKAWAHGKDHGASRRALCIFHQLMQEDIAVAQKYAEPIGSILWDTVSEEGYNIMAYAAYLDFRLTNDRGIYQQTGSLHQLVQVQSLVEASMKCPWNKDSLENPVSARACALLARDLTLFFGTEMRLIHAMIPLSANMLSPDLEKFRKAYQVFCQHAQDSLTYLTAVRKQLDCIPANAGIDHFKSSYDHTISVYTAQHKQHNTKSIG
ncbi:hypothetical protein MKEN_00398800 [Mycena kentingensis (nom. inval.)]|nr:hypothetical protein MKEN_00398800 [Mycena kentingensis (nom. inval.)]